MEAVRTWLGRDPAPLPHAHLVSWDGVERTKDLGGAEKEGRRKDKDWPIDVHTLTVASASGQIFRTQVAVAMTDAGPVVAADPSLTPYAPVHTSEAESSWQGAIPVSSLDGEDMALAARSWAEALYSGDGGRLRQAVGDADKSRAYVPMPAASAVAVKVRNVSALHRVEDGDVPSRVIARVSVTPTWGQARPDGQGKAASVAYDVLIVGANTASPRVVAWGGAGSGPSLEPYANAVTGIDLPTPSPTQSDQASPSATPSNSPSPSRTGMGAASSEPLTKTRTIPSSTATTKTDGSTTASPAGSLNAPGGPFSPKRADIASRPPTHTLTSAKTNLTASWRGRTRFTRPTPPSATSNAAWQTTTSHVCPSKRTSADCAKAMEHTLPTGAKNRRREGCRERQPPPPAQTASDANTYPS